MLYRTNKHDNINILLQLQNIEINLLTVQYMRKCESVQSSLAQTDISIFFR